VKLNHEKFGEFELVEPLLQRHVEDFTGAIGDVENINVMAYRRMVIEAAVKSGWFVTPPDGDIRDRTPGFVAWLGDALGNVFSELIQVPPS